MHDVDWNALKFILKVAESGSTAKAAQSLGVNATTVMRKITAFEQAFGTVLFRKKQSGYETTLECDALVDHVRRMEDRANAIQHDILQSELMLRGNISVSTVDSVMISVLSPCFVSFTQAYPNINVDISMSTNRVNLNRKDADIAIRATRRPPENVRAIRLSGLAFAPYASIHHADQFTDKSFSELTWIGAGGDLKHAPVNAWIKGHIPRSAIQLTADTFQSARALAGAGAGATLLPCCLGDTSPSLMRLSGPIHEMDTTLWIMIAADLENAPRIKLFVDHVIDTVSQQTDLLEGRRAKQSPFQDSCPHTSVDHPLTSAKV